ncbi:LXG domain-containing protein [Heyndrickxia sporothermodurans]|uniref:LXG domain-containing protein n=1 Tax=Heyndrickxia sporothermodurans TaxID=46224 RepID=UPI002E2161CD|nr:LXG domain-containing protein [Heyndrickxia sporothermodurans]
MKILKVSELTHAIDLIIMKKKTEKKQLLAIHNAVKKVIGLDDALKGEGGNAIRENFTVLHIPVLLLLEEFLDRYIDELWEIKNVVEHYESQDGLVREDFIEHDAKLGLTKVEERLHNTLQNIQHHLSSVNDLVAAPTFNTRTFDTYISDAKAHLRETIDDLDHLDHNSTTKLNPSTEKLQEIQQYTGKISNWTKNGIFLSEKEVGEAGESLSGDTFQKMVDDLGLVTLIRNTGVSFGAAIMNSGKLLRIGDLHFKMFKHKGKIYIKIKGQELKNIRDYEKYRKLLVENLGGKWKWNRDLVTELVNGGIPLYDKIGNKLFRTNSNKFTNSQFEDLRNYVDRVDQSKLKVASKTFKDEMKIWESFKGWKSASNLTKLGKGTGILGTGLTVYDDFVGNFYNDKTGKWEYTGGKQIKKFAVDTTIDLAAGAGAMAAGAAYGSALLPPAGTVVGAVAGALVFGVTNVKIPILEPPQSVVEVTKDIANKAVDKVWDCAKDVGKTLDKIFW